MGIFTRKTEAPSMLRKTLLAAAAFGLTAAPAFAQNADPDLNRLQAGPERAIVGQDCTV